MPIFSHPFRPTILFFFSFSLLAGLLSAAPTSAAHPFLQKRFPIQCFKPTPNVAIYDIIAEDCYTVARVLSCDPKLLNVPMIFSRDPSAGLKVPYKIMHETCTFLIDLLDEDADQEETAEMITVIGRAMEVVKLCVMNPALNPLGGRTVAGENDLLHIIVSGNLRIAPPKSPTRPKPADAVAAVLAVVGQCPF